VFVSFTFMIPAPSVKFNYCNSPTYNYILKDIQVKVKIKNAKEHKKY
jgi:hypothetical protein